MITIVAKKVIKKDCIEEFLKLVETLVEESNKEKGCIEYKLYQDINNPQILTFIEKWEDEEAIELHNKSEHFTTIVPQGRKFEEAPTEINLYKSVE